MAQATDVSTKGTIPQDPQNEVILAVLRNRREMLNAAYHRRHLKIGPAFATDGQDILALAVLHNELTRVTAALDRRMAVRS